MFRITHNVMCRAVPLSTAIKPSTQSQGEKLSNLVTQLALGFDPKRPPEDVILYRSAMKLYDSGNYIAAKDLLTESLMCAKKQNSSEVTISLYTKQLRSIEEFLQTAQKSSETVKRYQQWKNAFALVGAGTIGSLATYIRIRGICVPG